MGLPEVLIQAFWFMIPAYVANPAAVIFGGSRPMDFGKKLSDGNRLLGDGKTWEGFSGGILFGMFIGGIQWAIAYAFLPFLSFGQAPSGLFIILLLPIGSLMGDLLGSFIKRRMGIRRGQSLLILDQYDFLIGAMLILVVIEWKWFLNHYLVGDLVYGLIFIIAITPFLHRAVNVIGFKLGKKDVPW